eukprot:CAMPEP_0170269034 /NCGR_PEP_ID=MMETSP0116_2-20130129/34450_1 /TAXON_ID=400756 /ORGANISM="Durinskia baltica, Strain CSIRO CS-38" /LENGTH=208 /DNA_ID=CAMNT_0010520203 /DNA_START=6 /DNA_END=630 /DNA_ORIENTATION=-
MAGKATPPSHRTVIVSLGAGAPEHPVTPDDDGKLECQLARQSLNEQDAAHQRTALPSPGLPGRKSGSDYAADERLAKEASDQVRDAFQVGQRLAELEDTMIAALRVMDQPKLPTMMLGDDDSSVGLSTSWRVFPQEKSQPVDANCGTKGVTSSRPCAAEMQQKSSLVEDMLAPRASRGGSLSSTQLVSSEITRSRWRSKVPEFEPAPR